MARLFFCMLALFLGVCAAEELAPEAVEDVPEQIEQNDAVIEKRGIETGATIPPYDSLGCYKEDVWRVLKKYHGDFNPSIAIQECAKKAKFAGHTIFGVAYDKQCFSDGSASVTNAGKTYARLGRGTGCKNGRGGWWRINVYRLQSSNSVSYTPIGCYKDDLWRVIKNGEVMDNANIIGMCARKAKLNGNRIFGVEANKWCFTDGVANTKHAQKTYARLGKTTGCVGGKGGPWKISVYKVIGEDAEYKSLGCYKDNGWNRAIKGNLVKFNPKTAIQQCANRALAYGHTIFAIQHNDQCFTDGIAKVSNAGATYAKYGTTTGCENGRGHAWKMNVYSAAAKKPDPVAVNVQYQTVYEYKWVPADEPAEDESAEEPAVEESAADETEEELAETEDEPEEEEVNNDENEDEPVDQEDH